LSSSTKNSFSPGAHQIDADDMGVDPAGRRHADHLRQEGGRCGDQLDRHAARAQDFLPVIDVVQEGVDRAHPLLDPARQRAHSRAEMMRGTMSNGISRSSASARHRR
jgi:hypothetical protein